MAVDGNIGRRPLVIAVHACRLLVATRAGHGFTAGPHLDADYSPESPTSSMTRADNLDYRKQPPRTHRIGHGHRCHTGLGLDTHRHSRGLVAISALRYPRAAPRPSCGKLTLSRQTGHRSRRLIAEGPTLSLMRRKLPFGCS